MKQLITLKNVFSRAFALFFKTYLKLFPLLVLYGLLEITIDKIMPLKSHYPTFISLLNNVLHLLNYVLFFCFAMITVYHKSHKRDLSYSNIMSFGVKRFAPMLMAYAIAIFITLMVVAGTFIVTLFPITFSIITASILQKNIVLENMLQDLMIDFVKQLFLGFKLGFLEILSFSPLFMLNLIHNIHEGNLRTIEIIVVAICFAIVLFFFVAGVFIIDKNSSAWQGLKNSWNIIRNHWFTTFLIVLIWGITISALNWFCAHFIPLSFSTYIISLLTFSFGPCLMVTYYRNLVTMTKHNE